MTPILHIPPFPSSMLFTLHIIENLKQFYFRQKKFFLNNHQNSPDFSFIAPVNHQSNLLVQYHLRIYYSFDTSHIEFRSLKRVQLNIAPSPCLYTKYYTQLTIHSIEQHHKIVSHQPSQWYPYHQCHKQDIFCIRIFMGQRTFNWSSFYSLCSIRWESLVWL